MIPGAPAISNMVPATKQMRTLMYGSSGRNFTQSRPRSRVMNPNPARISAVIINARVTTSFRGCSASIESYSSQVRIPSKAFVTHSHQRPRHFVLTSRESSAFTIQQSVQVATTKNPVEKKAKKQAVYWRRPLMLASSLSGRDTWAAVSPGPPQVAGTLSVFWAAGTSAWKAWLWSWGAEGTCALLSVKLEVLMPSSWAVCENWHCVCISFRRVVDKSSWMVNISMTKNSL